MFLFFKKVVVAMSFFSHVIKTYLINNEPLMKIILCKKYDFREVLSFSNKIISEENSQNSQENTCARVSFLIKFQQPKACNFFKKEALAQVFSFEFCKISKNNFSTEHLQMKRLEQLRNKRV